MQRFVDHPAMGKIFEVIIGGIAYQGQCRTVWETTQGQMVAECKYMNTGDPDKTFKVVVDKFGKAVE